MTARYIFIAFTCACCIASAAPAAPPHTGSHPATAAHSNASQTQANNAYLARLRAKLQNNWYLPDGDNRVEISSTIAADGTIDAVQVKSTPKNEPAEQAASDAFSKAQPFEALPNGLKTAKLILVFHSKADPHGDSSSHIDSTLDPGQPPKSTPATK